MKVGILSMQRVVNYGSFLQAYALREYLTEMGHECFFIDIKPGRKLNSTIPMKSQSVNIRFILKRIDRYLLKRLRHKTFVKRRSLLFQKAFFPILGLGEEPCYYSDYDAIVIGSDEVFNCTQDSQWGFAKTLLGDGLHSDTIISYAASCGHTSLDKIAKLGVLDEVKNSFSNFTAISVRDENTKRIICELTDITPYEHIDPTLIYDIHPSSFQSKRYKRGYILVYAYDGRINDDQTIKAIRKFAKEEKKVLISAGLYQSWCDVQVLCTPFELLSYFINADYIITDTFHGTVFSIKYNKQFVSLIRESNHSKLADLLNKFKLTDRILDSLSELANQLTLPIDYTQVNRDFVDYRKSALEYFTKFLR